MTTSLSLYEYNKVFKYFYCPNCSCEQLNSRFNQYQTAAGEPIIRRFKDVCKIWNGRAGK